MNTDKSKTRTELLNELKESRQRLVQAEAIEKGLKREVEKSAHLASFPEANLNPVLELDQKGTIKYMNPATIRLFPNLATLGTNHPFLADWAQVVKELQSSNWGKTIVRDVAVESLVYEQIVSPVAESQIRIYSRNITELKKAEEALRLSETWYSSTLKSVGDAIIATDEKAYVRLMNSVAEALTGWNEKDAIGKPLGDVFNIVNEETGKQAENPVARVILEGVVVGLANHTVLIGKDGTKRSIDDSGAPIRDDKGNIIGTILVFRDVTEHRKMGRNLNERVKELTCLYGITSIAERPGITLDEIYQETVDLLPQSSQYPEIACAHLTIDGKEFKTANYRETEWKQSTDIKVHGIKAGMIEVVYLEERPAGDEGPFLREERLLIEAVAERMGRITERIQAANQVERLNLVLRTIRDVHRLITREKDLHELIRKACDILVKNRGYFGSWLALTDESGKPVAYSENGWSKDPLSLAECLEPGELTICGRKALKQLGVVITTDPSTECADCPVSNRCAGKGMIVMTTQIEYAGRVWGVFSVAVPTLTVDDEEEILFREVVQDLAFAFHGMEIEEQRNRSQAALRESQRKYEDLYDNAPIAYLSVDSTGRIVAANDAAHNWLGYKSGELVGKDRRAIYTEECQTKAVRVFDRFKRGDPIEDEEMVYLGQDGQKLYGLLSVSAIRDSNGQIIASRSVVKDITGRKAAEEKARTNEEKFRSIVENSSDQIFMLDKDCKFLSINKTAADISKKSPKEMVGMSIFEIFPEDVAANFSKNVKNVFDTGKSMLIEERMLAQGREFHNSTSLNPVRDDKGSVIAITGIVRDITGRKQAEKALKESEERFRIASQIASDVVYERDLQTGIAIFYSDIDSHLGYEPGEYPRTMEGWREHVHPEDLAWIDRQGMDQIEPGVPRGIEYRMRKKDGTYMTWSDRIILIRDQETGKPIKFIGAATDITERKRAEKELEKVDRLESLGILAGGIAHDFNNLLTGILGNVQLAKLDTEAGKTSRVADELLEAEKTCLRATDLTRQLLTFSRGGAPIRKLLSIKRVVEGSTAFALGGSDVKCSFSMPDDLWAVEADEGQIGQVISNLVINADQAMPQGGIIEITAANRIIGGKKHGLLLPGGNYIELIVRDHGIGISKEHIDRIFDPYFTTKHKGNGLGLTTAYSIIKAHGGHITVESELGVGTTFHVYLPATKRKPRKEEKVLEETPSQGKGRILVMDDEDVVRKLLYNMLTRAGYEVILTEDGAEAIERYTEAKESGQPIDAVILDLTVPGGMGGEEVMKKLLQIDPEVKGIVSSGYANDPVMAKYKKHGFKGVVAKPYKISELRKTLHSILRS